jgi:capsular polysaccharide biosynthesis protein
METECEVMHSEVILAKAVKAFDSTQAPGRPGPAREGLASIPERVRQLRTKIEVRRIPRTNAMEVCILSEDPDEGARMANALGQSYCDYQARMLTTAAPPGPTRFTAELMRPARTTLRPEGVRTLLGLCREALAAALLGTAAGLVAVLIAGREKAPTGASVLPDLFMIVFFVVVGVSLFRPAGNVAVAVAWGLLLGFVVGGVADWFAFVRARYPGDLIVFAPVFITVFLLVVAVGDCDVALTPAGYRSAVRLRLRMAASKHAGIGTGPGGTVVYDPLLIKTQSVAICCEDVLRVVIHEQELSRRWGKRYSDGTPMGMSWMVESLKRRIYVGRVPETCLIEIRAWSEKPEEAAELADAVARTYRDLQEGKLAVSQKERPAIRAEILDSAAGAATPVPCSQLGQLISYAQAGLALAFVAAGGVLRAASAPWDARRKSTQERSPVSDSASRL